MNLLMRADGWRMAEIRWILWIVLELTKKEKRSVRYEIMAGRKVVRIGGKKSGMNCLALFRNEVIMNERYDVGLLLLGCTFYSISFLKLFRRVVVVIGS